MCVGMCEMYRWRRAFVSLSTYIHERISMSIIRKREYQRVTFHPYSKLPHSLLPKEQSNCHCIETQTGLSVSPLKESPRQNILLYI